MKIDTGTEDLLGEIDDGVAVVTMNRPDRRNALSAPMLEALARVLADIEADDGVGCVVLTGAGGPSVDERIRRQRANQRAVSGRLWSMAKPTIAAIPGPAAGAGLSIALACDLRYAASGAILTTAFAKVALAGDYGGTWFLSRLVGNAKAKELYFFSERLPAEEAERLGIVNAVFAPADLDREVLTLATHLAAGPTVALASMKENLNRAVDGELGECMDLEATLHCHSALTADHRAAVTAFMEKRPADRR